MPEPYDLVVAGAGISALAFLQRLGEIARDGRILVVDYQPAVGGFLGAALPAEEFPTESALVRDFQPWPSVTLQLSTTAVGLAPGDDRTPHQLLLRSSSGATSVTTRRVIIATGSLETPREHDAVPGMRPSGVMTPVLVHQLLGQGYLPGRRAIVFGQDRAAALVARRLAAAGAEVTLVPPDAADAGQVAGVQVAPPATISGITGRARVEGVTLRRGERLEEMAADTLIYAQGALPNTLWLRGSGIALNEDGSICVDGDFATSIRGVVAIGTVVKPSLDHRQSVASGRAAAEALGGGR